MPDPSQIRPPTWALGYFIGCNRVLDAGCGQGAFLEMMAKAGISAVGVDSNPDLLQYPRSRGYATVEDDVVHFLSTSSEQFDGIWCSHLIEHLAFEALVDLAESFSVALSSGGVLVLVFPNPECLQMQTRHFWVDPDHKRFYHPALLTALFEHYAFEVSECLAVPFHYWGPQPDGSANPRVTRKRPGASDNRGAIYSVEATLKDWVRAVASRLTGLELTRAAQANLLRLLEDRGQAVMVIRKRKHGKV
jgi:O-antigen chain-terminating methyltransferase